MDNRYMYMYIISPNSDKTDPYMTETSDITFQYKNQHLQIQIRPR